MLAKKKNKNFNLKFLKKKKLIILISSFFILRNKEINKSSP
jgi:hypothetical protein